MRFLLAALAAFFVSACVADAPPVTEQVAERCGHRLNWYPGYKAEIRQRNAGREVLERYLDEAETVAFNKAYNETPPQSHRTSANVAVWVARAALDAHLARQTPNNSMPAGIVVWIGGDGCIQTKEIIPLLIIESLLSGHAFIPGGRES